MIHELCRSGFGGDTTQAGRLDKSCHAFCFGSVEGPTCPGQPVVPPTRIVQLGIRPLIAFLHESVLEESAQMPVQCSRIQNDITIGKIGDCVLDGVPVVLLVNEDREHEV